MTGGGLNVCSVVVRERTEPGCLGSILISAFGPEVRFSEVLSIALTLLPLKSMGIFIADFSGRRVRLMLSASENLAQHDFGQIT